MVGLVALIAAVVLGVFACAAVNVASVWLASRDPVDGGLAIGLALVALLALAALAEHRP